MKKSSLLLLSLALAGAACAKETIYGRDLYTPETHPVSWVSVALGDPVQLPRANYNITGFRWDIFYGNNFTVKGLDLGLVGHVSDAFTGLSLMGVSWTEGDATGAQLAGLANVANGNVTGFELAGLLNFSHGIFTGLQLAPVNYDGTFVGVQLGALNWDKGVCSGLQLGLGNIAVSEFHGWSFGAINYTERLSGLQFGVFNVIGETGRGVQIGCFNGAPQLTGVQIGLLNIIGNAAVPVLPFVNANF